MSCVTGAVGILSIFPQHSPFCTWKSNVQYRASVTFPEDFFSSWSLLCAQVGWTGNAKELMSLRGSPHPMADKSWKCKHMRGGKCPGLPGLNSVLDCGSFVLRPEVLRWLVTISPQCPCPLSGITLKLQTVAQSSLLRLDFSSP